VDRNRSRELKLATNKFWKIEKSITSITNTVKDYS